MADYTQNQRQQNQRTIITATAIACVVVLIAGLVRSLPLGTYLAGFVAIGVVACICWLLFAAPKAKSFAGEPHSILQERRASSLFSKGERDKAIEQAQRQRAAEPSQYSREQRRRNRRSTAAITIVLGAAVLLRARNQSWEWGITALVLGLVLMLGLIVWKLFVSPSARPVVGTAAYTRSDFPLPTDTRWPDFSKPQTDDTPH